MEEELYRVKSELKQLKQQFLYSRINDLVEDGTGDGFSDEAGH